MLRHQQSSSIFNRTALTLWLKDKIKMGSGLDQ
jgi:hypothetical protein